ncbi:hypothetical protein IQ235_09370 [Oscillatoriales cyanobacterium LEGE 11467]|uniref:Uncharacterized protein n=1 Tax=Zarconia navalis LEGE 11467 TaxID=1828826 RepID=A0A928Z8U8_9CYAN|nr:hypothetical protein [Zarconia navalis]MBE9040989.1 hypothetical protein [Zarconia navalis LEGE 11467]
MPGFVGIKKSVSTEELQILLEQWKKPNSYYCLRWHHQASDIVKTLKEAFPSPEGRMFDAERELRWKQLTQSTFSLLLLSENEDITQFEPLIGSWEYEDRASISDPDIKIRLPQKMTIESGEIGQRYFRDRDTGTVHFIALTVMKRL